MTTYHTRADLMRHPAFAALDADTDGNPVVWRNLYDCADCNVTWGDDWSCQCDDDCPECGASYSPVKSVWIGPEDAALRAVWEELPEAGA